MLQDRQRFNDSHQLLFTSRRLVYMAQADRMTTNLLRKSACLIEKSRELILRSDRIIQSRGLFPHT